MRIELFDHSEPNKFQRNFLGLTGDPIHTGSWGTTDIGLTEFIQKLLGGSTNLNQQRGSTFTSSPAGGGPTISPIQNITTPDYQSDVNGNPVTTTKTTTGGPNPNPNPNPKPNPNPNPGTGVNFDQLLNNAWNAAQSAYNQGKSALASKEQQFLDSFNQGKSDILTGFQKGEGELQSSAAGAATRNANALRALGLGGSAVFNTNGRQTQANMQALGTLENARDTNTAANQTAYNTNEQWANGQSANLDTQLGNAASARQSGAQSILDSIVNNQMAAAAAGVGNYLPATSQVNIPSMVGALTNVTSGSTPTTTTGTDQNVSIDQNSQEYQLLKQLGLIK
jgi:hypothetical protein